MSDDIKIASEDEAAAWMYPSALEWFKTGEHSSTAWSIKVGSPDEPSPAVPLYTADQLRAAVLADRNGRKDDGSRLDWLEAQINQHGAIHLHDGTQPYGMGLGLRPGCATRSLRVAIDQANPPADAQRATETT